MEQIYFSFLVVKMTPNQLIVFHQKKLNSHRNVLLLHQVKLVLEPVFLIQINQNLVCFVSAFRIFEFVTQMRQQIVYVFVISLASVLFASFLFPFSTSEGYLD